MPCFLLVVGAPLIAGLVADYVSSIQDTLASNKLQGDASHANTLVIIQKTLTSHWLQPTYTDRDSQVTQILHASHTL